jgi:hypothetical protein
VSAGLIVPAGTRQTRGAVETGPLDVVRTRSFAGRSRIATGFILGFSIGIIIDQSHKLLGGQVSAARAAHRNASPSPLAGITWIE